MPYYLVNNFFILFFFVCVCFCVMSRTCFHASWQHCWMCVCFSFRVFMSPKCLLPELLDIIFICLFQKGNVKTGDRSLCNPNPCFFRWNLSRGSPGSDGFLAPVLMPFHCTEWMICWWIRVHSAISMLTKHFVALCLSNRNYCPLHEISPNLRVWLTMRALLILKFVK